MDQKIEKTKCLIIGSGPAGLTAAIYASRANLSPILYEGRKPGGQLTETTEIENFPGYPEGITGLKMMEDLKKQAQRFGADVRFGSAVKADLSKRPFHVTIDGGKIIEAQSVIIATGASAKYLGIPDEKKFWGKGVSGCATCDGFFYRGKNVGVVGGGDTACEESLYLSGLAKKVFMIVRRDVFRASKVMQKRVLNTSNIEVLWKHEVKGLLGNDEDGVTGARLFKNKGTKEQSEVDIPIDGFFLAIGHKPNSDIFKEFVETNSLGYIVTKPDSTQTNIEGVFAAGDIQDMKYRQAITAAGTGCMAAIEVERWLSEQEE